MSLARTKLMRKGKKLHKIYIEFMKSIHLFSHTHKFYCLAAYFFSSPFLCVIYMFQALIYVVCYACEFIFSCINLNEYVVQFGKFLLLFLFHRFSLFFPKVKTVFFIELEIWEVPNCRKEKMKLKEWHKRI